ncbi:MAG: YaiI/YqxD family protein [Pseudomonadota bacterium]
MINKPPAILIDADACPVKNECYRVGERLGVPVVVVSNSFIRTPDQPGIYTVRVSDGFDAADDWIAENAHAACVVITADILLAERCLEKGAQVLSNKGSQFTPDSIGTQVATRAIMADLRAGAVGQNIGGPAPFTKADRSKFLQALDGAVRRAKQVA